MLNNKINHLWKIWGIAFIYTCLVSLFVQFILLPYFFPRMHAGGGLFTGCPDSVSLHQLAVELAERIKQSGWGAWRLRPHNQSPAGIASMVYALTWSKLWVLIPLNAALHASAFLILFQLINLFIKNQLRSFLCVLPFLVFPSNLQWTAQLHKDGLSILGAALILYSLVILVKSGNLEKKDWRRLIARAIVFYLMGIFLIWLARPYMLMIVKFIMVFFCPLLIATFFIRWLKGNLSWQKVFTASGVLLISLLILSQTSSKYMAVDSETFGLSMARSDELLESFARSQDELAQTEAVEEKVESALPVAAKPEDSAPSAKASAPIAVVELPAEEKVESALPVAAQTKDNEPSAKAPAPIAVVELPAEEKVESALPVTAKPIIVNPEPAKSEVMPKPAVQKYIPEQTWKRSFGCPLFIEKKAFSLAQMRGGFRYTAPEAGSNIDIDVGFNSLESIIAYLPRAAQIVFLAPFPNHRFSNQGSYAGSRLMRRISGFEMAIVYFGLFFLWYAAWYWRKRIEMWVIAAFCIYFMLIYGLIVCNVGTLYRMRYLYITILAALGIAGFFALLDRIGTRRNKDQ
jgi:hypothetical protein